MNLLRNDVFVFAKEYFHPFNPAPLKYKPLIVVGPSGVGKTTLINQILSKYGGLFERKVSYTTRPKKGYEKQAANYQFITKEDFMRRVERNEFVEWCNVNGNLYGTAYGEMDRIKQKGKIPIIEVDVQGAIKINERAIEGNFLFIYPPSFEELRRRLGTRLETEEEFKLRIQNALKEIELSNNSVLFTNRLVNDELDKAIDQFYTLIEALYFQELKNLAEKQEQEKLQQQHSEKSSPQPSQYSQSRSSYESENKKSQNSSYSQNQQQQPYNTNGIKPYTQDQQDQVNEVYYQNQKKLQSLMNGNDLQPLEEEVSKEEDESLMIKLDHHASQQFQQQQQYQTSYPGMFTFNNNTDGDNQQHYNNYLSQESQSSLGSNQNNINIVNYTQSEKRNSAGSSGSSGGSNHTLSQKNIQKGGIVMSTTSLMSGDCNYNSRMEEAAFELIKIDEDSNIPKIFDPQFQQSYEKSSKCSEEQTIYNVSNNNNNSTFMVRGSSIENTSNHTKNISDSLDQQQMKESVNRSQQENNKSNDINQIQKDKAKRIIESLKAQNQKQNSGNKSNNNQPPVEKRLFDYQKQLEEKIEQQRKMKEEYEKKLLRPIPQISEKSNEILLRRSMMLVSSSGANSNFTSPRANGDERSPKNNFKTIQHSERNPIVLMQNYQVEQKTYFEEQQRKEEMRIKILEEKEMQGFTGKPQINSKSKSLKRKVEDLIEWKEKQEKKKEEEFQKKQLTEYQQWQQLQSAKVVNKQSEKIVEQKTIKHEKVEDRLLRDANLRMKKQQIKNKRSDTIDKTDKNRQRSRSQNQKLFNSGGKQPQLFQASPKRIGVKKKQSLNSDLNFGLDSKMFSQSVDYPLKNQNNKKNSSPQSNAMKNQINSPAYSQQHNQINTISPNTHREQYNQSQVYDSTLYHNNDPLMSQNSYYQMLQQQSYQNPMMNTMPLPYTQQQPLYSAANYNSQPYQPMQNSYMILQKIQHPQTQQVSFADQSSFIPHSSQQNSYQQPPIHQQLYNTLPTNLYSQPNPFATNQASQHQPILSNGGNSSQSSINSNQSQSNNKSKKQYMSLYDKLQRMNSNTSHNYEVESSRNSSMPIISANQNQNLFFYSQTSQNSLVQTPPAAVAQLQQTGTFNNPVYQQIQEESQKIKNQQLQQNINQAQHLNQQLYKNYILSNQIGGGHYPSNSLDGFPMNQDTINTAMNYPQGFNPNNTAPLSVQYLNNFTRNNQFANQQDVIIHKILENSFIPSGNVGQIRRVSCTNTNGKSQGCTGGMSSGDEVQSDMIEYDDINGYEGGTYRQGDQIMGYNGAIMGIEDFNSNLIQRNINDQGIILDSDQISYNSRISENIVKNLNQALSDAQPQQQNTQFQNFKHHVSSPGNRSQTDANQIPSTTSNSPQANLKFMDRNNQWLENKKIKLTKAKEIHDMRQERECPFKPSLNLNARKANSRSKSNQSKSMKANQSQSSRGDISSQNNFSKLTKEQEIQVNSQASLHQNQVISQDRSSISLDKENQQVKDYLNGLVMEIEMVDNNGQKKGGCFKQNMMNNEFGEMRGVDTLQDISNCDISSLSPDNKPNESILQESMMSIGANEFGEGEAHFGTGQIMKVLNKKTLNF